MAKPITQKSTYDLIVIGSGPAGQRAAVQAAKLKKSALVIEKESLGGSSLHTGTIPSKTLREAALNPQMVVHDPLKGVMKRKEKVIGEEMAVITRQLERNGVEYVQGEAKFHSPHEVVIGDSTSPIRGEFIVIATGTSPYRPADLHFDNETLFDSDSILKIKSLPGMLAVVGAGVIGCEYASIFAKLGIQVTLFDRRDTLFRFVDLEVTEALRQHFIGAHMQLELGAEIKDIQQKEGPSGDLGIEVSTPQKAQFFNAALYCMGRNGNTKSLNLAAAGVAADNRGIIKVNKNYQTEIGHIYAVGDVIGNPALAASSSEQGRLAALHAFKIPSAGFPESFPYGIYTIPEISCVGMQEEDLKQQKIEYVVGRAYYKELARGKILEDEHGFLKILVDKKTKKLLGIHILGTGATELIHIGQIVKALDADVEFLVNNVFNYPTLAEAYKVAALHAVNQLRA